MSPRAGAKDAEAPLAPLPRVSTAAKARAMEIFRALRERYPDARCELDFRNARELLIATILSAQATDVSVNKATPALFKAFPTAEAFAQAAPEDVEPYIRTIGLYRNKAKAIVSAMKTVVEEFGGEVPSTMEELLRLRGVARKTANVVLSNAFNVNMGVVVDTHVERLAKRFKLAPPDATVPEVERRLMALFPRESWGLLSHLLIFHGRRACKARAGACAQDEICMRFCTESKARRSATKAPGRRKAATRPR